MLNILNLSSLIILVSRGRDLLLAVRTAELSSQPLLETFTVERVPTVRHDLDFNAAFEIGQADGAALIFERVPAISSRGHRD